MPVPTIVTGSADADVAGGEVTPVAALQEVTRRYGELVALDRVDLVVRRGEFVGLLGPNGAGKSTIINLLLGLRRPDVGVVRLFGRPPSDPVGRARVGCTPQETALPENLRVAEVVEFVGRHYVQPIPTGELLEAVGLGEQARRQTGGLSGGQRRRLALALALVGRPDLLILDEPTTGLDVQARHELWASLRDAHARGVTIILTSHYLEEIQALAHRVVALDRGRVLADDGLDAVLARVGVQVIQLTWDDPGAGRRLEAAVPGLVRCRTADGVRHELAVRDADAAVRALVARQIPFRSLAVRGASLEEALAAMADQSREVA